jgi:hypothetical protein
MVNAMVFCPDDGIDVLKSGNVKKFKTYWIGYWKDYNRFLEKESQPVPDTGIVVNYTMRRIIWELDWLIDRLEADPERISLMGGSMGGRGANYLPRAYPDKFSAWLSLSPGIEPQPGDPLFGSKAQNLITNLPGNPRVLDVMDLHTMVSDQGRDIPFGKIVGGRADNSLAALSPGVVQAYRNVNDAGHGTHIYWDDRGHVFTSGSYWSDSERLSSTALTQYESNCSFPAFFNDDQDFNTPGRQPDLGTGTGDGDDWGTWGGYYGWDPEQITDTPSLWKSGISLVTSSEYGHDIPVFDSSKADLAIRKPQQFKPAEGTTLYWAVTRISDGRVLQSGQVTAGPEGLVTVPGVIVYKEKCEIAISKDPAVHDGAPSPGGSTHQPGLRIYPNPASSSMSIQYDLEQSARVKLAVFSIDGKLVDVLADEYQSRGHHLYTWSVSGIAPGVYICRFCRGQDVYLSKAFCHH